MVATKRIMVQVLSPTKTIFTGSAVALTSINDRGRFDILPYHANFVSIVNKFVIIYPDRNRKSARKIDIGTGVLHCQDNAVKVFVDIATAQGLNQGTV